MTIVQDPMYTNYSIRTSPFECNNSRHIKPQPSFKSHLFPYCMQSPETWVLSSSPSTNNVISCAHRKIRTVNRSFKFITFERNVNNDPGHWAILKWQLFWYMLALHSAWLWFTVTPVHCSVWVLNVLKSGLWLSSVKMESTYSCGNNKPPEMEHWKRPTAIVSVWWGWTMIHAVPQHQILSFARPFSSVSSTYFSKAL